MNKVINQGAFGAYHLGREETEALGRVIDRKQLFRFHSSNDPSENDHFEQELGAWLGGAHACSVASGTAGLRAALVAVGVVAGDVVAVSAMTFVASASAILSLGARPEPVELGSNLQMDIGDLNDKLKVARAVISVYFPGHASNITEVTSLAHRAGVAVIEDACQALGVSSGGSAAGITGDLGVYSFQQGKQLCSGEGGAVVSRDAVVLAKARRFADHGACRRSDGMPTWEPPEAGFGENLRLSELQAAVLRVQLGRIDQMLARQRQTRAAARELLLVARAPVIDSVDSQGDAGSYLIMLAPSDDAAAQWTMCARANRLLLRHLWRHPFFTLPPFARAGLDWPDSCPRARSWSSRLIGMPVPPFATEGEVQEFLAAIRLFCNEGPSMWG